MRVYLVFTIILLLCLVGACGGDSSGNTPSETLKAYTVAVKKKDVKMIKLLLSKASLKIHREQAKAQNVSIDEIILRETLFPVDQKIKFKRNEKIEGDSATIEVKNSFDGWDMIYFVQEDGIWKIDKKGFSDNTINQNDTDVQKMNEEQDRIREQEEKEAEKAKDPTTNDKTKNPDPKEKTNPADSPSDLKNQDDRDKPVPDENDVS